MNTAKDCEPILEISIQTGVAGCIPTEAPPKPSALPFGDTFRRHHSSYEACPLHHYASPLFPVLRRLER